ncbi:cupin domain-containing protein [Streptomyces sp. RS10V-4]|uniref:cupin domain-containing protein n=1 Tax=Streptomyces rhizoryzae TaxID=2932493 RepID=UPI0020064CA8|nr:cupin domain-containing protein [Streptomyces rhizoryzae]MCK7626069.1 cupin domain-containing protein [Streptomyces rhizoryzae]
MPEDRFFLLDAGASRPTRVPLPPHTAAKAAAEDTEGRFSLLEHRTDDPGALRLDGTADAFLYVLDGDLGIDTGGRTHHLTRGMCALVPRGAAPAAPRNLGGPGAPLHVLQLTAPGGPDGGPDDPGRFFVLGRGQARPGRVPLPPAFAVKARTTDTGGRFSFLEVTVAQPVPRHTHHLADECVYVLDGELAVEFGGLVHTAGAGQLVLLPHGVPHAIRPGSTPPPRVLQISAPGGWECVVESLIEHRTEVSRAGRLDPAALNRYTRRYSVTYEEE